MKQHVIAFFDASLETLGQAREHLADRIVQAVEMLVTCYRSGGGLLLFGNGGSAADAQHIAAELVGRFLFDRPGLKAEALPADMATLTSIANDYDYASVFARQVQAKARPGDVAWGLSTSGNSANVVAALAAARKIGMKTLALTGQGGGKCAALADVLLDVPSGITPHVQEAHVVVYHTICKLVEAEIFSHGND